DTRIFSRTDMQQTTLSRVSRAPRTQRLARAYLRFISNLASATLGVAVTALLGFAPFHDSVFLQLALDFPSQALAFGAALLLLIAVAVTIAEPRGWTQMLRRAAQGRATPFIVSATLSAVGSAVLAILLGAGDLPSSIPLLTLIRQQPPLG